MLPKWLHLIIMETKWRNEFVNFTVMYAGPSGHHNLAPKIKTTFYPSVLLDHPLWKQKECFPVCKCKQLQKRQGRMRWHCKYIMLVSDGVGYQAVGFYFWDGWTHWTLLWQPVSASYSLCSSLQFITLFSLSRFRHEPVTFRFHTFQRTHV